MGILHWNEAGPCCGVMEEQVAVEKCYETTLANTEVIDYSNNYGEENSLLD